MNSPVFHIDLRNLISNYNSISKLVGVCGAVVKCNAYGFGAKEVTKALLDFTCCNDFFVSNLKESLEIINTINLSNKDCKRENISIYLFNGFDNCELDEVWNNNLIPVCFSEKQIKLWNEKCENNKEKKPIVIQIETGLNRLGMDIEDFHNIKKHYDLNVKFVMHHLACGYNPEDPLNRIQLNIMNKVEYKSKSLSSSCSTLLPNEYHGDLVRLGRFLYGSNEQSNIKTKTVGKLYANILSIKNIKKGSSIGYSREYIAKKDMRIAIVNIGYGDGYSVKNGYVFTNENYAQILSVSMEYLSIDITNIEIKDDLVELLGENITFDKISKWNYSAKGLEITTLLGKRIEKKYLI